MSFLNMDYDFPTHEPFREIRLCDNYYRERYWFIRKSGDPDTDATSPECSFCEYYVDLSKDWILIVPKRFSHDRRYVCYDCCASPAIE